jgi:uncharacterized protein (TIGR00661 family)
MERKIIVAPLNWGLGHASRCVPIIRFLLENKFTPIIASDGSALTFLQKEFPSLESLELPSYKISYTKNLKFGLLLQVPKVFNSITKEHQFINDFVAKRNDIAGIISDNRLGIRSNKVPSVYITHQLNVLSGVVTYWTSMVHQYYIKKFNECWVPDTFNRPLSGKLSENKNLKTIPKYIGPLSRFSKQTLPIKNDFLIILSGIESQRKSLENKLMKEFKDYRGAVVMVRGVIEEMQTERVENGIKIYNYLLAEQLEKEINQSEIVICRSGYSSIMDIASLKKKAFFIPTKNQTEQEYLARYLQTQKLAPFVSEKEFVINKLKKVKDYKGLSVNKAELKKELLSLFECK